MAKLVHDYGAASMISDPSSGLAVVQITGLITPAISLQVLRDNAAFVARNRIAGQVAVYSGAAMAITADSMLRNAQIARIEAPELAIPTAIVAPAEAFDMCRRYCALMCEAGFWRRAFLDYESALRWAAEYAQIREDLLAQRRPAPTEVGPSPEETTRRVRRRVASDRKPRPSP